MDTVVGFLPWIGLAIAAIGLWMREEGAEKGIAATSTLPLAFPPSLLAVASCVYANYQTGDVKAALFLFAGAAAAGVVVTLLGMWRPTSALGGSLVGLGLAAFVAGFDSLDNATKLGGLVAGLAVGTLPSVGAGMFRGGPLAVVLAFSAGVTYMIARVGYGQKVQGVGVLLIGASLVAIAALWATDRATKGKPEWLSRAIGLVVLAGLAWLVAAQYLAQPDIAIVAVVSVAACALCAVTISPEGKSIPAWGIVAVVWLGVATFAFSNAFGLGMAVAGLCGLLATALLARHDLMPAIGVVVGLSFYRLFRENNPEVVQAFDIGQHYALIGFLLGVFAVVGLADALMRRKSAWLQKGHVSATVCGLIAGVIVVGASAFFGTKGAIGICVGLAVAPLVSRITAAHSAWTVAASAGLQAAVIVAYRPAAWDTELDRDAKLRLLWILGAIVVVLAAALLVLERNKKVKQDVSA